MQWKRVAENLLMLIHTIIITAISYSLLYFT
jgi:hypothetical protein